MPPLLRVLPIFLFLVACTEKKTSSAPSVQRQETPPLEDPHTLSKSSDCIECHKESHEGWKDSHHALAHRKVGTATDAEAFADREVTVGDAKWQFEGGADAPQITWEDTQENGAETINATPPMAIGEAPLIQYLMARGNGRYQVPDMAWDPTKKEWFSIYDDQNRRPEEWGHWTQRGMNWNSQCAWCHFTGLRKDHDPETDSYKTQWVEQGVGCAQCHGPDRPNHGTDECRIDPEVKYTKEQWTQSCATCHARREEFDEKFITGRSFFDHYGLALPSQPGLWHPDGQQLDEVYKYNSLLMSRMGHKGIGCTDCHDPHAAEPIGGELAVRSNALCLTCHAGGANEAVVINPAEHVFHDAGTPGASCVDCHMPKKNYMQRDARSDHRFPRPDPLLTKEIGTPNACNNCHEDKGLDWQIEWTHKWYGEDMNQVSRQRTRAIHSAQTGKTGALGELLAAFETEEIDAWQATLLRLMEPWLTDSRVVKSTNRAAREGGPIARAAAALLIARRGDDGAMMELVLNDSVKSVRTEAAWAALERLDPQHPAIAEIKAIARHQSDQPGGAMRMARIAMSGGETQEAEKWFKRAADWDRTSPSPRRDLAVFLGGLGRTAESVEWLEAAAELAPGNPEIPYLAALAYAEIGDSLKAEARLGDAVRINPNYSRAWYNLGLLYAGNKRTEDAVRALIQAERTDPSTADAPYARATIHLRMGQVDQAIEAAREAVRRDPNHPQANQLINQLGG